MNASSFARTHLKSVYCRQVAKNKAGGMKNHLYSLMERNPAESPRLSGQALLVFYMYFNMMKVAKGEKKRSVIHLCKIRPFFELL